MGTRESRGVVVFVDRARWACFDQMASALGRLGVRTVRLTADADTAARTIDRFVYAEARSFAGPAELAALLAAYDRPDLLDVVAVDELVPVVASVPWRAAPARTRDRLRLRGEWVDKVTASRRLAAAGVAVPGALLATEATAEQAADALGLPLVVKGRVGAGGAGVRVAATVEQVRDAVTELGPDPSVVFYEAFVQGADLCVAAAYDGERVLDEVVYESHRADGAALGPSSQIVVRDDPEALAVLRAAARAVGGSGLVGLDLVRGPDGPLVVDVNLRVWGSSIMLSGAGARFDRAYLAALTGEDLPSPSGGARPGTRLAAFPDDVLRETLADGRLDLRRILTAGRPFVATAGLRYVVAASGYVVRLWFVDRRLGDSAALRPVRGGVRRVRGLVARARP